MLFLREGRELFFLSIPHNFSIFLDASSKIEKTSTSYFASLEDIDYPVTNYDPDEEEVSRLNQNNVELIK